MLLNAAVAAVNVDTAADADDAVAAANAVEASALPAATAEGSPGGDLIAMAWVIALLAPLIALILVAFVWEAAFAARWGGLSAIWARKVNHSLMRAGIF